MASSLTSGNIKFVAVARATDKAVLCFHLHQQKDGDKGQYIDMMNKVLRAPTWQEQVAPNSRHTLECDPNKFHFSMDDKQRVYILIAASDYPVRLTFDLLEKVRAEVSSAKFSQLSLTCKENGLKDLNKRLKEIATEYDDRTKGDKDKIGKVQAEVDNVKNVMQDNIKTVLNNTEKMESMEAKSTELSSQAKAFKNSGTRLKHEMWWRNLKFTLLLVFAGIFILFIILLIAGVFTPKSSSST